jgi:hypothetical protein
MKITIAKLLRDAAAKIVDIGEKRMDHYHAHPKILLDKKLLDKIRSKYLGELEGYKVYYVNGALIREKIDIDYCLGGNGARYSYVPETEFWLDETPEKEDHAPTLLHEYEELRKMKDKDWGYDKAHDYASGIEKKYRLQEKKPSDNPIDDVKAYLKEHPVK